MAVVSTEQIHFMRTPFKRVIRVLKDGHFRIAYPKIIQDTTGKDEAVGKTMSEAMGIFADTLGEFEKAQTTSRKVILYEIDTNNHFAKGMNVAVSAKVYIESKVTVPDGTSYYCYDDAPRDQGLPSGLWSRDLTPRWGCEAENALEWTEARHLFFERIFDAMKTLKTCLDELSDDQEKLLEMADSGAKLLPN